MLFDSATSSIKGRNFVLSPASEEFVLSVQHHATGKSFESNLLGQCVDKATCERALCISFD
jgi:hypothetical protein